MLDQNVFIGFSKDTVQFFNRLKKHNERDWFQSRRDDYESYVLTPARSFVVDMGERLKQISPNIQAVPKIDKSLFRLNRDTRFSADKSPYKTHMGIFFWEGQRPKMECSGFYFHLEPPHIMFGVGIYRFPKQDLHRFRKAAGDPDSGERLSQVIKTLSQLKGYDIGGKFYKRIPSGFDSNHPNSDLLLHNGLYAGKTVPIPDEMYSAELINYCWKNFKSLAPLHLWLVENGIGFF
ncbi:MAG: DUF2461 domain-containing protein [Candidatus Aminicenantes bacterium]|nr:DUF2461 domain-containing protein [Candidatus Aminicenantes bacterium]